MKRTKLADLDDILRNNMQDERGHSELSSEHLVWGVLAGCHRLPTLLAGVEFVLLWINTTLYR